MKSSGVFVSWTDHGRSRDIARVVGLDNIVPVSRKSNLALKYAQLSWRSWKALRARRPDVVFFMQPPAPLLLVARVYASSRRGVVLYGDLHSGFFNDSKWSWFTSLGLRLLGRHHVIVTNEALANVVGDRVRSVHVLHDVLNASHAVEVTDVTRDYVLCPLSYAADEPIDELLQAARLTPEVVWKLTGRAPQAVRDAAPENVEFTGFVSQEEYESLLGNASAALALTSRADTMQRAGYEALSANTPLVASRQRVLVDFFGSAAVFADHDAASLSAAVRSAISDDDLRARMAQLLVKRMKEQSTVLDNITALVQTGR